MGADLESGAVEVAAETKSATRGAAATMAATGGTIAAWAATTGVSKSGVLAVDGADRADGAGGTDGAELAGTAARAGVEAGARVAAEAAADAEAGVGAAVVVMAAGGMLEEKLEDEGVEAPVALTDSEEAPDADGIFSLAAREAAALSALVEDPDGA